MNILSPTRVRARVLVAGLLAALVAVTAPAAVAQAAPAPTASASANILKGVTLKVGGQTDGLRALLASSGALKGKAYAIQWATFTSGPPLMEALQAGKIDIGGVGNAPPLFAAATKPNFRLVAGITQTGKTAGDYLLVPKGSSITSISQLKGKKIAYTRGSSGHGFLVQALRRYGLTEKDVTLADLAPGDALAAFRSGSVDAWATWEPFASIAGDAARILPSGKPYAASGLNFFVAGNSALGNLKKRTAIRDYLVRLQRAVAWGTAHKPAWAKAFHDESGLPIDIALHSVQDTHRAVVPATGNVVSQEQTLANALAGAGVVEKINIPSITSNQLAK